MENNIRNVRLAKLMEREKELNCLYTTENLLINDNTPLDEILNELTKTIPPGWQYPTVCECRYRQGQADKNKKLNQGICLFVFLLPTYTVNRKDT
ncbi:MAG: hypothetical protein HQ565_03630 [Bacteroidetes bacterium]|nr:hypothetical protein [Bacteroidota bacterium]